MKNQTLLLITIISFLIGCKSSKETTTSETAVVAIEKPIKTKEPEKIVEKYWKLISLNGAAVKMAEHQKKEAYFMLKLKDNSVKGFAGCNSFYGTYTLNKGNRIQFSQLAATEMYCENINESEFLKIFNSADNYTIQKDTLSLTVGKRAPLAVFEAIWFD